MRAQRVRNAFKQEPRQRRSVAAYTFHQVAKPFCWLGACLLTLGYRTLLNGIWPNPLRIFPAVFSRNSGSASSQQCLQLCCISVRKRTVIPSPSRPQSTPLRKVVAYTRSKLHFAMLSLFLELRARLPNVIIGAITRESMRRALATGIKGRQVLDFLKWHAHPIVRRRSPVVPENIADQVRYCHVLLHVSLEVWCQY